MLGAAAIAAGKGVFGADLGKYLGEGLEEFGVLLLGDFRGRAQPDGLVVIQQLPVPHRLLHRLGCAVLLLCLLICLLVYNAHTSVLG